MPARVLIPNKLTVFTVGDDHVCIWSLFMSATCMSVVKFVP